MRGRWWIALLKVSAGGRLRCGREETHHLYDLKRQHWTVVWAILRKARWMSSAHERQIPANPLIISRREFVTTAAVGCSALVVPVAIGERRMVEIKVLELRQYTLLGGRRETLIELFEREFVDSQAAVGAPVIGTFRDLDDPDRFVWLRGFADMETRKDALETFYKGPVWRANREAANATMVDSDNVLLLKPYAPGSAFIAAADPGKSQSGIYAARIHSLGATDPAMFAQFFDETLRPLLKSLDVTPIATLVTETHPNTFPALPVRENEPVFVWFGRWPDAASEQQFADAFARLSGWRDGVPPELLPALAQKPERLRLAPTTRSRLQ
jgi:hypothetical protein